MAEIPPRTLQRAKVIVDQREEGIAEAGDLIQPIQQGLFTADLALKLATESGIGQEVTL